MTSIVCGQPLTHFGTAGALKGSVADRQPDGKVQFPY